MKLSSFFYRELLISQRHRARFVYPILFCLLVVMLFPLSINPAQTQLKTMAPAILWVAILLAQLLTLPALWREDYLDGSLEQLLITPQSLSLVVMVKMLTHWLMTSVPLIIVAPVLAYSLQLPVAAIGVLVLSLLLATPSLSLLGGMISALILDVSQSSLLLLVLLLPLYLPILIFGASSVQAASTHANFMAPLLFLSAILVMAIVLVPVAIAASLRVGVS